MRPPLTPAATRSVFRFGRRARPRPPGCGMSPAALSRLVTVHPPNPHPLPYSPLAHPEGAGARRRVPHAGGCRRAIIPQWGAPLVACLPPLRTGAAPALRPHRSQAAILPPAPFLSAGARQRRVEMVTLAGGPASPRMGAGARSGGRGPGSPPDSSHIIGGGVCGSATRSPSRPTGAFGPLRGWSLATPPTRGAPLVSHSCRRGSYVAVPPFPAPSGGRAVGGGGQAAPVPSYVGPVCGLPAPATFFFGWRVQMRHPSWGVSHGCGCPMFATPCRVANARGSRPFLSAGAQPKHSLNPYGHKLFPMVPPSSPVASTMLLPVDGLR